MHESLFVQVNKLQLNNQIETEKATKNTPEPAIIKV
jgi:hypothetical protein